MSFRDRLNIGIIGSGRMGVKRAEALNAIKETEINWICSRSKERGSEFAHRYGIENVITDWKEGCSDPKVDGVIITSPNSLHEEMASFALNNDKHVLLEYPVEISVKRAKNIVKAAKESKGKLHTGLTYRVASKHLQIKKLLSDLGEIGTGVVVMCSGNKISRWFDDKEKLGNIMVGSNFHYIDELIDWFGPVAWVDGHIYEKTDRKMIERDIGSVMLGFAAGFVCTINYARGWEKPGLGFNCQIIGEKGYLVDTNNKVELWLPNGKEEVSYSNSDSILKDTQMFVDYVLEDKKPLYTTEEAIYALEVAEAAFKSAGEGKRIYLN